MAKSGSGGGGLSSRGTPGVDALWASLLAWRAARSASAASAAARASISSERCVRSFGCARSGTPSAKRPARFDSAWENSDGITKTLFAWPLASSGSICRYW